MALPLRQSTAIDIRMGSFMDSLDAVTPEVGITLAAADQAEVLKADGAATVAMAGAFVAVTGADGWYDYTASTTDTDTVGECEFVVQDTSVCLPVRKLCVVLDALVYDALYGSSPTLLTAKDIGQFYESTVGTVNSTVSFDMDTAIITNDNWIGQVVTIEDVTNGETVTHWIVDVLQATNTIVIDSPPVFTVAIGDVLRVESRVHPRFVFDDFLPPTRVQLTSDTDSVLNKIRDMFRVALRNDAAITTDQATEIADINADQGAGIGTFSHLDDALQALEGDHVTAQADLDTITGSDGVTLATAQALYAPSKAGDAMDLIANAIDAAAIAVGGIEADAFAAGAINAAAIATGAITAAKFAAGAIDAAAINTDAGPKIRATITGTADSGSTTTMVDNARTEADTDYWKGAVIRFTSGNIDGQTRIITGFVPASDTITFSPPVTQAVATQTYELLDHVPDPWVRVLGNTTFSASAITQLAAGTSGGKMSGLATATVTMRDLEDAANMVVATVDADGNRSAVTIIAPAD